MCTDPGLALVKNTIKGENLDGVVLTTCSPSLHGDIFRTVLTSVGLASHQLEIADLRGQDGMEETTEQAIEVIIRAVERLRTSLPTITSKVPITKRALVIGGGIAGIQAALDIADGGYEVVLVERTPSIGGHMIQLSKTFPTLDCPQCIMTPKMVEIGQHPNVKLLAYSEVEEVSGKAGNFRVKIKRKASFIDRDKCTGCEECIKLCPVEIYSDFQRGVAPQRAIYKPFPQAVPNKVVIDPRGCLHFNGDRCRACEEVCPAQAIDFLQEEVFVEEEVGAIVVATGYELLPKGEIREFEEDPDIIDGLQFERILCPSGPTDGVALRPSDGKVAKEVVFISCVGSRDPEHGLPYCSRVCCMYSVKMAMLYKHAVHDGQAYIFYMDIRVTGKGYEEFVTRAVEENGVLYLRGRVSKVFRDGDKIKVWGLDTLTGKRVEISCDLVVLAMAMIARPEAKDLARKLGIATDEYGFMAEIHPKLRPLESAVPGIYLAGTAQGPKDIPDTVAQASGAASKVLALFSKDELILEKVAAS